MGNEHECTLIRNPQDADTFHEFINWLNDGGMKDLRYVSAMAASTRSAGKVACGAIIVLAVGAFGAIVAAGFRAMFRVGVQ